MANNSTLKSTIANVVKTNGNGEINGQNLQNVLLAMVNVLGEGYMFLGGATPSTDPGTPDNNVFYLATEAGTYSNFGGDAITSPTILYFDTQWHSLSLDGDFSATLRVSDIVNALNSTSTTKPLSANMGKTLNNSLNAIVSALQQGYVFMGVATTDTPTPSVSRDYNLAYLAVEAATYTSLGGLTVADNEIAVLERYLAAGDVLRWRKVSLGTYLKPTDVVDALNSTETQKPLSAKQGKVLKDLIDAGYTYGGTIAADDARTPSRKIFYLATTAGTIHDITVAANEIAFIKYDGSNWTKDSLGVLATSSELTSAVEELTTAIAAKYTKPADGIPASDMTEGVQASLSKADSAVQPEDVVDQAKNLESWAGETTTSNYVQKTAVETTGGTISIDSSVPANLDSVVPLTDFFATSLLSTGFNLLRNAVQVGTGWYFEVPHLVATNASIGTALENNGVLFTSSTHENLTPTVYFKPLASGVPESVTDGTAATYIDKAGRRHYTTSGPGYLIVSGIDRATTCAHIGWSRHYDEYISVSEASDAGATVDLAAGIHALHDFDKMLVIGAVADYIERSGASQITWHRRIDRVQPTWTNTAVEEEGEPTGQYIHTADISNMKADGAAMFMTENIGLSVDGTTVSYTDSNATASTDYVKFELAAEVTGTASVSSTFAVEDWGLIVLRGITGTAAFNIAYAQNVPDNLRTSLPIINDLRHCTGSISQGYGVCTTGTYDKDKVVTIQHFLLLQGGVIHVLFTTPINTERTTLNVSLTGAKPLRILGQNLPAGVIKAQTYATIAYDGEAWNIVDIFCPDASFDPAGLLVDMGLPSGTKWAARDLDLTKPGGFCDTPFTYEKSFFSWGNIDGHNPVSNSFSGVYNWGSINAAEPWYDGQVYGGTKGATLAANIPVGEEYDAARANLGSPWRMPLRTEFQELINNCIYIDAAGTEIPSETTDKRVVVNGVRGIYLQSTINGNRLFFACSGNGSGASWSSRGSRGYYWSATFYSASSARDLGFDSDGVFPQNYFSRYYGFAVRPVQ